MTESQDSLQNIIKRVCRIHSIKQNDSVVEVARIYLATIALLNHIKKDQATLRASDNPQQSSIPAINAVINNKALFSVLLKCLEPEIEQDSREGRKRAMSVDLAGPSKVQKLTKTQSPIPPRNQTNIECEKPSFPVAVVAASILYASFQHLDHWPAVFVKHFAEDSFGARRWVDDDRCSLFTQNLATIVTKVKGNVTEEALEAAREVSEAYSSFDYNDHVPSEPSQSLERSSSLGSQNGRLRGTSFDLSLQEVMLPSSNADNGESSDSGDEEVMVQPLSSTNDDSSSGEEDEVMLTKGSGTDDLEMAANGEGNGHQDTPHDFQLYPNIKSTYSIERIRNRFVGENLVFGQSILAEALRTRLENKTKQNSALLQNLPSFLSAPSIRRAVAESLERWLQSPALAGLARTLFSSLVDSLECTEIPSTDDLITLEHIIDMDLKANQQAFYVEAISSIAKKLSTASFINRVYVRVLRKGLRVMESSQSTSDNPALSLFTVIHGSIDKTTSYEAIAVSLLSVLSGTCKDFDDITSSIASLHKVVQYMAKHIPDFEGDRLVKALLSLDVETSTGKVSHEEEKIKLIMSCVFLHVSRFLGSLDPFPRSVEQIDQESRRKIRASLVKVRRQLLSWCCCDYLPVKTRAKRRSDRSKDYFSEKEEFSSYLSTASSIGTYPSWLTLCRRVLFLESINDSGLKDFFEPLHKSQDSDWENIRFLYLVCHELGRDLDETMLRIALKSHNSSPDLSAEIVVDLLECLVAGCSTESTGAISVSNPSLLWDLYELVTFDPVTQLANDSSEQRDQDFSNLPRLAKPYLWWKVTLISFVFAGSSPSKVGNVMWEDHPTVRMLIKMIVSGRYRFPTVDCDESQRSEMKRLEQEARDEETSAAEKIFLPKEEKKVYLPPKKAGSRASKRLLKQQEDQNAAKEKAELERRKALLKNVLKLVMLWDPSAVARKPPREVAEALLSIESEFGLSVIFQRCKDPDFILQTIGDGSRGAIERAHDWLIPIISVLPDAIERLPSSASCFLILRAYGGDKKDLSELKMLAQPLLVHVRESLQGSYGKAACRNAIDVLMTDFCAPSPDRRRCARRVFQDALKSESRAPADKESWMLAILQLQFIDDIIAMCISKMSQAASFERGQVLRDVLLSLAEYYKHAESLGLDLEKGFATLLVDFIAKRQDVYSETFDSFEDLQTVVSNTLCSEFSRFKSNGALINTANSMIVSLRLRMEPDHRQISIPYEFLQSFCVLLSVWRSSTTSEKMEGAINLLLDCDESASESDTVGDTYGLASTTLSKSGKEAVPIEMWVRLAKSRSDVIARRAALSAPTKFLARLLLCTGLPEASLITMIDRLGKLGQSSSDKDKTYESLLNPPMSDKFDICSAGPRFVLEKRLLDRLHSYLRLNEISINSLNGTSSTFYAWLSDRVSTYKSGVDHCSNRLSDSQSLLDLVAGNVNNSSQSLVEKKTVPRSSTEFLKADDDQPYKDPPSECTSPVESVRAYIESSNYVAASKVMETLVEKDALIRASARDCDVMCELLRKVLLDDFEKASSLFLRWYSFYSGRANTDSNLTWFLESSIDFPFRRRVMHDCVSAWNTETVRKARTRLLSRLNSIETVDATYADLSMEFLRLTLDDTINKEQSETLLAFILKESSTTLSSTATVLLQILLKGQLGVNRVCKALVEQSEAKGVSTKIYDELVLREYLMAFEDFDLGDASVRSCLLRAAQLSNSVWTAFPCSIDSRVDSILAAMSSGEVKSGKFLAETARSHPLLLLRRMNSIVTVLQRDAEGPQETTGGSKEAVGKSLGLSLQAKVGSKLLKVHIVQWGYVYHEQLWFALLDIVMSIPNEILLDTHFSTDLKKFLSLYVLLLSTRDRVASNTVSERLRNKLKICIQDYQRLCPSAWANWIGGEIDGIDWSQVFLEAKLINDDGDEAMTDGPK